VRQRAYRILNLETDLRVMTRRAHVAEDECTDLRDRLAVQKGES
jgi:hypothetical protein